MNHLTRTSEVADARVALLQWTARLGAVTADALAWREGIPLASARARLAAAVRRGELARTRPLTDHASVYAATRAGLRACATGDRAPVRITAANAAHAIACARVAAALELAYPGYAVLGEPELRALETGGVSAAEPRLVAALRALPLPRRPDILLALPGDPAGAVAVEVELTVKAPRRLASICRAWARCRAVAGTLYVAAPVAERPLARAVTAAAADDRVTVLALAAVEASAFADPVPSAA